MVIRRCAWHRDHFGYPALCGVAEWNGSGLRFTDWVCRRCVRRLRGSLGYGTAEAPEARPARVLWDPVVLGPPVVALIVVLGMLLTTAGPVQRVSVPAPAEAPRELRPVASTLVTASTQPVASRPRRPSIQEEMILAPPETGSKERTEPWSPPLMVPASGPLGLRSVQAP
jgi:hypothetical protein